MTIYRLNVPHVSARETPDEAAEAVTDYLFGETVTLVETQGSFVRVRNEYDGYEGWIAKDTLLSDPTANAGVKFRVRRRLACAYAKPAGRIALRDIGIGSPLHVAARIEGWLQDVSGLWFKEEDILQVPAKVDRAGIACEFVGVPYVWGGRHGSGIDCSGLVQIGAMLSGLTCPRDTKDQVHRFGRKLGGMDVSDRQRGDVLYVPGHVAILINTDEAVHADGKAGKVHIQPLENIVANRGFNAEDVTIRRPE